MKTTRFFNAAVLLLFALPAVQMTFHFCATPALSGVQEQAERPGFGWKGFLEKSFQLEAEKWFSQNYGLHEVLVKTHNQILFTVFRDVHNNEGVVLGKDGQLLGDDYIRRTLQFDPPVDFVPAVKSLARIHNFLRSKGKALIVFVTPSKSSFMREDIPNGYLRFPHYEPDADYRHFVRLVREAGVPLVDAREEVFSAAATMGHPPFPRTGIHWDQEAAGLAASKLLERIELETGRGIGKDWSRRAEYGGPPTGSDKDYGDLLNLWFYNMPEIGVHLPGDFKRGYFAGRLSGVFEGGSFNDKIIDLYIRAGLFKELTFIAYNSRYMTFPGKPNGLRPISGMDWDKEVFSRDFLVLEINESLLNSGDPGILANGFLKSFLERETSPAPGRRRN